MENMQWEIVNENVEFKDIGVDEQSIRKNSESKQPIIEEEEDELDSESIELSEGENDDQEVIPIPPPIISTREGMVQHLEVGRNDTRYMMEVIRASTINFTDEQRKIIEKIEKEYEEWCHPTRMVNYFDKYATELRDTFYYQAAEEEDFFQDQMSCYSNVYHILARYPFPYSNLQINLLESYKAQIEWTTGDPTQLADIELLEDLHQLMSLMASEDHTNYSTFYVDCTVEFYVQQMINDLYYPAQAEQRRKVLDCIPEGALVNVANYVMKELESMFHGVHWYSYANLFHLGLSQVYTKMINIFRFSGLRFNERQEKLLNLLLEEIEDVVRSPTVEKYDVLFLGFYGFMDALRRDHQERETKEEEGFKVIDEEGTVAKAIKKIMREFYELQIAAEEHHKHFEDYTVKIPEVTSKIFKYVLRIFPPNHRVPIHFMLPNGYYVSFLAREWIHEP